MMSGAVARAVLSAAGFAVFLAMTIAYYAVLLEPISWLLHPKEFYRFDYYSPRKTPGIEVVGHGPLDLPAGWGAGRYAPVLVADPALPREFALDGPGYKLRITLHTQWDFARWRPERNLFSFEATDAGGEPLRVEKLSADRCAKAFTEPGFVAGADPGALVLSIGRRPWWPDCAGDRKLSLRLLGRSGETAGSVEIPFAYTRGQLYRQGGDLHMFSWGSGHYEQW